MRFHRNKLGKKKNKKECDLICPRYSSIFLACNASRARARAHRQRQRSADGWMMGCKEYTDVGK